ncbi:MAG TPA: right-handed parallel beta-helix repeat-containing protein [Terriglobia bacterium]|nr:right-handed parallel beta-helix repeat-containing protein [Terriglobia bacterium]
MNTNGNIARRGALPFLSALIAMISLAASASATTWYVGPTRTYTTPCQAIAVAAAGDTIYIDYSPSNAPGVGYYDDTCSWTTDNLTLIGVPNSNGARPVLNAAGLTDTSRTGHLALHKGIWVPQGSNTVVENMEFENAALNNKDGANGAGIREDGSNLTVLNCYFHNNQDGLLESNVAGSNIVIENSEFYQNGVSDKKLTSGYGQTHNLYIGHCASLLFEYNFTHDANVGHLVKSRAAVNYILYNRITGENGTDSYEIDLPNGGTSYVIGNEIEQGPNSGNSTMLSYLEEGVNSNNPGYDLYVVNNTFVNQLGSGTFVVADSPAVPALLENNIFYGPGAITDQSNAIQTTNFSVSNNPSMFVNFANYNYDLSSTAGSPPIDSGTAPESSSEGYSLAPIYQYVQHTDAAGFVECEQPRITVNNIDIGAYEFGGGGAVTCPAGM